MTTRRIDASCRGAVPTPAATRALVLPLVLSLMAACRSDDGAIRVAPPTGDRTRDQASLRVALDSVRPGGTVQFASGTYRIGGDGMEVKTSDVTLAGHPEGTILQGCAPDSIPSMGEEAFFNGCAGLMLTGGRQVVRDLTFEHFSGALAIGGAAGAAGAADAPPTPNVHGGHTIRGNTFRNSVTLEVDGHADSAIVIRGNTFRNTYHAVAMQGRNIHVLENDVAAPEPERVPYGWPSLAIGLRPQPGMPCTGNRIERNTIEGHTDGVIIGVLPSDGPGATCTGNSVRNNEIRIRPVLHSKDAGPLAGKPAIGVAIRLLNLQQAVATGAIVNRMPAPPGGWPAEFAQADVRDNTIDGNRIVGAKGVAIELFLASGNRVTNNRIGPVTPFSVEERGDLTSGQTFGIGPGFWLSRPDWAQVNGTTIWVSPGSADNTLTGNVAEGAR